MSICQIFLNLINYDEANAHNHWGRLSVAMIHTHPTSCQWEQIFQIADGKRKVISRMRTSEQYDVNQAPTQWPML